MLQAVLHGSLPASGQNKQLNSGEHQLVCAVLPSPVVADESVQLYALLGVYIYSQKPERKRQV